MSYIRSGSNPEKLYIVGTDSHIEVMEGSKDVWNIPYNVFQGLIKKYDRMLHEFPCEFKGAKLDEVWVDDNGHEQENQEEHLTPETALIYNCKVKLTYGENKVYMWFVTWEYITNGEMDFVRRFTPHKVYVQWDPLYEKVLCVHEKPNKRCKICKKASKDENGYQRSMYQIEEKNSQFKLKIN
jgi:hypothetical protein